MTPLWTAEALQAATAGAMPRPFAATGISIDTRSVQPGDLFIALQGTTDGHAHAAAALAKGAAGVLVARTDGLPADAPILLVPDTLAALTALGRAGRARFSGRVVAVTGSVGKTTTKEMLRTALSAFGPTHAAEASYNNHWGVPLTLARLPASAAFAVIEIGMNNPGEIAPLAALAAPHAAIITTVAPTHIGHLGSLDAIAVEKATLLDHLTEGGVAVIPSQQQLIAGLDPASDALSSAGAIHAILTHHVKGLRLVFGPGGDVHATGMSPDGTGTAVAATVAGKPVEFRISAPGAHMVANALATLAACQALGLDAARAAAALAAFAPLRGRGARRQLGDILLLDESYNASAASVRAALDVLRLTPASRRIAVLGDMLELGDFAPTEHAGLAPAVAGAADLLYACGPLTRSLFDRVPPALRAHHADDAEALAPIVAAAARPGDAILVKGSLGSRMRVVVSALESRGSAAWGAGA